MSFGMQLPCCETQAIDVNLRMSDCKADSFRGKKQVYSLEIDRECFQMNELVYLANVFARSSTTALHRGTQGDWIRLRELLQIMQPVGMALIELNEVDHYVQRLYQHVLRNRKEFDEIKFKEVLDLVFVEYQPKNVIDTHPRGKVEKLLSSSEENTLKNELPGDLDSDDSLFYLSWKEIERKLKPQQLNLIDIQLYLPSVMSRILRQESVWENIIGLSLLSVNTDLPFDVSPVMQDSLNSGRKPAVSETKEKHVHKTAVLPRTGIQAVEYLVRHESSNMTKIWFLNQNMTDNYDPYDLIVVPRNRVCPEHFVISVFGVLHVKLAGQSELTSLGQWYREAVVFRTIRKINYFRNFIVSKAFAKWKKAAALLKFLKIRKQIEDHHLLGVPHMMSAILNVKSLLLEMHAVKLLPCDSLDCYTLIRFNQTVRGMRINAKKFIRKLYKHCQSILSKVEGDSKEYLLYCEMQVSQRTDNIKESMTVLRQRRNKQVKNLKVAKYIEEKLPSFARLIEIMLHQFLLCFISESIVKFVKDMMQTINPGRDGLFFARFEFHHESCVPVMSPSSNELIESVRESFTNIPLVLEEACADLNLVKKDAINLNSSNVANKNKQKLNAEELRTLLKYKPMNASTTVGNVIKHLSNFPNDTLKNINCDELGSNISNIGHLQAGLDSCILVKESNALMENLMHSAFEEVEAFAQEHKWMNDIHSFVAAWNQEILQSWKGQSASKIERQVEQIRQWISQVQRVDGSVRTSNGILFVDNSHIQELLVPGLEKIFSSLMDMTASHCLLSSEKLIEEFNEISESLSHETSTFEDFALYYQKLGKLKEVSARLQNREEYVKSIFEVVRHYYRQLTPYEEETEENVTKAWNTFRYSLQEANNRINELLPRMLENLTSSISKLEAEALEITEKVTSGDFLDATKTSKIILPQLKALYERFVEVKEEVTNLVKYEDMIQDEAHDLTPISALHDRIIARYELWKYVEVTSFAINEWMHTPFHKFQITKAIDKVTKWRSAISKLKVDLPLNDDVLCSWIKTIEDFGQNLPFLEDLSSISLKHRHWKWLFGGFGEVYDQSYKYTVSDLIGFDLVGHSQLIMSICDSAVAENALESHLKKLVKRWEEEEFKLAKYYQERRNLHNTDKSVGKTTKVTSTVRECSKPVEASNDIFILTGVNELQYEVMSNLVTLQSMLVSRHSTEMRGQVEAWSGYLHQLKEILDLWTTCQEEWLYLKKIFSHLVSSNLEGSEHFQEFNYVDMRYQEHMMAVQKDPLILSVLHKKKGEPGYRQLQGHALRDMLIVLVTKQEQILKNLGSYLSNIRASFPRLHFMSNNEMFRVLASSRSPMDLVPFVRKCFPGIINLKFSLPPSVASNIKTQLDARLNDHLLEIVSFCGELGEEMGLPKPIAPTKSVEEWFSSIESTMKSLMWSKTAQCIEERLLCNPSIYKLIEALGISEYQTPSDCEILNISSLRKRFSNDEIKHACWYLLYPLQCVLTAEEFVWSHNMDKAFVKGTMETVEDVRKTLDNSIEQCSNILHFHSMEDSDKRISRKVIMLIQNLLVRYFYHREITKDLIEENANEKSFRWLQTHRYQMEISHRGRRCLYDQNFDSNISEKFGNLNVVHMGVSIPYGYEYQGLSTRIVITPLTDKALFNLTKAMSTRYVGGLFGPSESGKTETMREVAKILQYVSGAVQSGALLCFDNADRLSTNILAVLGQYLDDIRQAFIVLKHGEAGQFEGRDPGLKKTALQKKPKGRKGRATVISLHAETPSYPYSLPDEDQKSLNEEDQRSMNMVQGWKSVPRRRSICDGISFKYESPMKKGKDIYEGEPSSSNVISRELPNDNECLFSFYEEAKPLGDVLVAGSLVRANPLFSCMLTVSSNDQDFPCIPDTLKITTRLFGPIDLDCKILIEVLLIIHGFLTWDKLAKRVSAFREVFNNQFLGLASSSIHLSHIRKIICLAKKLLAQQKLVETLGNSDTTSTLSRDGDLEERVIGSSIHSTISPSVYSANMPQYKRLLERFFPQIWKKIGGYADRFRNTPLLYSVKQQLMSDILYAKEEFVLKVMELYEVLSLNTSVILLGDPGTGKSACYQTLCRALSQFSSAWNQAIKRRFQMLDCSRDIVSEGFTISKVHLSNFYHKAMTTEELFGGFDTTGDWSDGLLTKTLRTVSELQCPPVDGKSENPRDPIQYWFVFDGTLDSTLSEPLESLLDIKNELLLANGERIRLPDSVRCLFETSYLACASPGMIARSSIVNFEDTLVDWKCFFHSWKNTAQNRYRISAGLNIVERMLDHINQPLTEFLSKKTVQMLSPKSISYCSIVISSILHLLVAVLDRFSSMEKVTVVHSGKNESSLHGKAIPLDSNNAKKDVEESKSITNAFAFAFVWAVAGHIHESCYGAFDEFTRQLFASCPYSVRFPCSVFECIFDQATGELSTWKYGDIDVPRPLSAQNYVITLETEKYFAIADLLVSSGYDVLVIGDLGVGKTSFVQNLLQSRHKMQKIGFCQALSPAVFQTIVKHCIKDEESLSRSNLPKPSLHDKGQKSANNILFIDDISMVSGDPTSRYAQPTLEVLRQMISEGRIYDHERRYHQHLPNLQFFATCLRHRQVGDDLASRALNPRLTRRMISMNMKTLSNESLHSIYTNMYKAWLQEFPAHLLTQVDSFAKALARASVEIFNCVKQNLTESLENPHYLFSHHDIASIANGVFLYSARTRHLERRSGEGRREHVSASANHCIPNNKLAGLSFVEDNSLTTPNRQDNVRGSSSDINRASLPVIRTILRLWCHEVCRTFYDQLTCEEHKSVFLSMINNVVAEYFCRSTEEKSINIPAVLDPSCMERNDSKSRVKFKDVESSQGPFISMPGLYGEDVNYPTEIIFSKHLSKHSGTYERDQEIGYVECMEHDVEQALENSLKMIRSTDGSEFDLVLYKEALHHATKISRILTLPGGHALLLSVNGHGRANTVRLVATLANMKIIFVSGEALNNAQEFRKLMKNACITAGLHGKPVILYIAENLCTEGLKDVAGLLTHGNCPGLFTLDEMLAISSELLPGGMNGKKNANRKAIAHDRFNRRVMSNLHIVLCHRYESMKNLIDEFPCVISRVSCIDVYYEWNKDILEKVAEKWLMSKGNNEFLSKIFRTDIGLQMTAIYRAMAQIHTSARTSLDVRRFGIEIFSPLKFIEFIDLFKCLCNKICSETEGELETLTKAITKVEECRDDIQVAEKCISELTPTLTAAKNVLKKSEDNVMNATKDYRDAKQACNDHQQKIESLEQPLLKLRQEVQQDFSLLAPMYDVAMDTLKSIGIHHLEEMRSYRDPPDGVKFVGIMLCEMFEKATSWDEAKLLLMRDHLFQDLIFYEKQAISDALFKKLERFCMSADSDPDKLMLISKAASSIAVWIRAVYNYCCRLKSISPKQCQLKADEMELKRAKELLGERRIYSYQRKKDLESHIEAYKNVIKQAKSLEKQLQVLQHAKHKAESLLESMHSSIIHWDERNGSLREKLRTAPGDALLAAASIIYLAVFTENVKEHLKYEWIGLCNTGFDVTSDASKIPINGNFSLTELLSTNQEDMEWKGKGFLDRSFLLEKAIIARTCCITGKKCWPFFLDPHNYAPTLVRRIEEGLIVSQQGFAVAVDSSDSERPRDNSKEVLHTSANYSPVVPNAPGPQQNAVPKKLKDVKECSVGSHQSDAQDIMQVLDADDTLLDEKLKAAVVQGLPTIVHHYERGASSSFLHTLLTKGISCADGKTQFIAHGHEWFKYHPKFRLYLSATVNLTYVKNHRFILPLHKTFVINMAIGKRGLEALLASHTIHSVKPELLSQQRSVEVDLFHLQQKKATYQDGICEALCNISGKIVDDVSLPKLINENTSQLSVIQKQIEEGENFQMELKNRWYGYYEISSQASFLYEIVYRGLPMEPYYEPPLNSFEEQFKMTLANCKRQKAECGSTITRVAEISSMFSLDIYKRVCLSVFKECVPSYSAIVAAHQCLLDSNTNESHLNVFLKLCTVAEKFNSDISSECSPSTLGWLNDEALSRIDSLEALDGFSGLLRSFKMDSSLWKEYFSLPLDLAGTCPCDFQSLTIFHKALLWLAVLPSKRSQICSSLVSNTLGPDFTKLFHHRLVDILKISNRNTPILIFLPPRLSNNQCEGPVLDLQGSGKAMNIPVITISLGIPEQLERAEKMIRNSFSRKSKKWIVLQNCHLETSWSQSFLKLLEDISDQRIPSVNHSVEDCTTFRLWLIFRWHKDLDVPFQIAKVALQVAWDEKCSC